MISLVLVIALFGCALADLPDDDKCGRPAIAPSEGNTMKDGRIVGGKAAVPYSWPWMVQFTEGGPFCAGSLLSRNYVLTAGHCVDGSISSVTFRAGRYSKTGSNEPYEQRSAASQKIIHELYVDKRYLLLNDVAIVRLRSPFTFTSQVSPVCLPKQDTELADGEQVHVTGWGRVEDTCCADVLKQVRVPIFNRARCNDNYRGNISSDMICAGLEQGGLDSCQGDSGGPLVIKKNGRWEQFGITSWGWGCADPKYLGVYANVAVFKTWIQTKLAQLEGEEELVASKFRPVPFGSAFR